MSAVLAAAHAYVERLGWAVLPCFGKLPAQPKKAGGRGWLSATRNHDEIDRLWKFYGADSIGIACKTSGFFAVDVDPRDGGDETLRGIIEAHEELPRIRQITGSGGAHLLFKAPADFDPIGSLGPGIQIKWCGYVIGAPSLHEKTRRAYAWDVDCHPRDVPIAAPPAWLLSLCIKPKTAGGKTDWSTVEMLNVHTGDRTNTLTRLAGVLFRKRIDPAVVSALLWAWNQQSCHPPLPMEKVEKTLAGILERELIRRGGA
jgi:Bifunctional DNA primase/polymerase, N-terminal/Primase C terminal 1 (PriCT-1)